MDYNPIMDAEFVNLIKPLGWIIFGGILVFFIIISIILNYHWTKYGVHPRRLKFVKAIYFGVSAISLITMGVFLFLLK